MLNECLNCTTRFAADLTKCPHCGSGDYELGGAQQMPKIARFGGPSYEGHEGVVYDALDRPSEIDPDHQGRNPLVGEPTEKDKDAYAGEPRRKDGEEETSPGNSSSESTENVSKTEKTNEDDDQKPALVTENPSKTDHEENSTAASAASSSKAKK